MPTVRKTPRRARPVGSTSPSPATLRRRLARTLAEQAAERTAHARRVAALRRAQDRRIAALVQDIASLRHHEARVEALTRLVAERDAALGVQATRIAELETLLQHPTPLR